MQSIWELQQWYLFLSGRSLATKPSFKLYLPAIIAVVRTNVQPSWAQPGRGQN